MSEWTPVVGVYREPLPMACPRENWQEVLAKSQSVRKRQDPQDWREPVVEPQTLKGVIGRHLNLQAKWQDQKFKTLVDSGAIRNHMSLAAIKRIELPHRQREKLYPLVTISGDPISYGNGIIHFKTGPVEIEIEGWSVEVLFNVLLLSKNEAVLGMLFL